MNKKSLINRKSFLKKIGLSTTGALFVPNLNVASNKFTSVKRVLRIAHLTDVHLFAERGAEQGFTNALHHVQNLEDKPDIIFFGGDCIMDALEKEKDQVKVQWDLWNKVIKNECELPTISCIGNHDVWGWELGHKNYNQDKLYGKQWALEELNLESRYYSFDKNGWHFIVLDSTHFAEDGYTAKLDEEQFEWLEEDLKHNIRKPVCVLSHIPIISFTPFFDGNNEKSGDWIVPGAWMHIDARRMKDLFYKHPNVKLALSGHIHMQDIVEFLGVKYLCNGAVCGAWWKGNLDEFAPAYFIVDLYEDGSSDSFEVNY